MVFEHRKRTARTQRNREFVRVGAHAQRRVDVERERREVHPDHLPRPGRQLGPRSPRRGALGRPLFVGDNAALANALGGPNPTLTSQALCTRTAERIFTKYFGGDPWVASESPVSSLDDRVTAGVMAGALG